MPTPKFFQRAVEALMALSLLVMVIAVFGNVVQRYLWGTGWVVSEEHLGFDLVTARLHGRRAAAARWLARGLIAVSLYYLIVGAWQQVLVGMDSRSPVMNYPLALGAGGILFMGVCMAVILVAECWTELRGQRTGDAA